MAQRLRNGWLKTKRDEQNNSVSFEPSVSKDRSASRTDPANAGEYCVGGTTLTTFPVLSSKHINSGTHTANSLTFTCQAGRRISSELVPGWMRYGPAPRSLQPVTLCEPPDSRRWLQLGLQPVPSNGRDVANRCNIDTAPRSEVRTASSVHPGSHQSCMPTDRFRRGVGSIAIRVFWTEKNRQTGSSESDRSKKRVEIRKTEKENQGRI